MAKKSKAENNGTTLASLGALCTIFSLTVIEHQTWGLVLAILGVVLALGGVWLIQKAKNKEQS